MRRDDLVVSPGVYPRCRVLVVDALSYPWVRPVVSPADKTPAHTTVMNVDEFLRSKAYAIDEP